MVVDVVFGVSQRELHLEHQETLLMLEIDEDIPGALVEFVLHPYNLKLFVFAQLRIDPEDLFAAAGALAAHQIEYAKGY